MWDAIQQSTDSTIYFVMAVSATLVFLVRLVMAMLGGDSGGHGGDFDVHMDTGMGGADHAGVDAHHPDSTATFQLFSVLSLLAFFMGAGWMGLACRIDWRLGPVPSLLAAVVRFTNFRNTEGETQIIMTTSE